MNARALCLAPLALCLAPLALCLAPLALCLSSTEEPLELRAVYTVGQTVSATSEQWTTTTYDSILGRMDGELVPADALGPLAQSLLPERTDRHLSAITTFEEVVDGEPRAARRRFERLELRERRGDARQTRRGVYEGRTLALKRREDGTVAARLAPQERSAAEREAGPDARFLDGHLLAHPVDRYLPTGAVAVGDRWELSRERILQASGLSGGALYFESEKHQARLGQLFEAGGELAGEVRFEALEVRDGLTCALLSAELFAKLHATDLDPTALLPGASFGEAGAAAALHFELKFSERVWFAIDAGRPVAASAQAAGRLRIELTIDQEGHELELTLEARLAGANESRWKEESAT